ncbi:cytochrome C oxidase copper chaperone-domain-containing protein [Limtongia smithiae]|uniref:cytochrome C oxidase copper chaperone-domain-containing protein n=1 Tax=Limtongia smithiae TaxID=1125753 RepID=UPI0034CE8359
MEFAGTSSPAEDKQAPATTTTATESAPASRPKPCCVCLDEKMLRDECMLMNEDGKTACADTIAGYRACMKTFGFTV